MSQTRAIPNLEGKSVLSSRGTSGGIQNYVTNGFKSQLLGK